ncbi:hypothetical protein Tco_1357102 [Tanacetum coccineum]
MLTVRDDSILGSLRFVSKTKEYQVYGALIPKEITNRKMRNSIDYKTYLAFATGAETLKKARKFKKPTFPSKKKTLVAVEEPAEKPANKPATRRQSAGLKNAIKQSRRETNIHQAGGSSKGAGLEPEVLDEQKGKSSDTSEETGLKSRVLDVSKAVSFESEYKSWIYILSNEDDEDKDDE